MIKISHRDENAKIYLLLQYLSQFGWGFPISSAKMKPRVNIPLTWRIFLVLFFPWKEIVFDLMQCRCVCHKKRKSPKTFRCALRFKASVQDIPNQRLLQENNQRQGDLTCPSATPEVVYFPIIPCRNIFCSFYTAAFYQQWQFPINKKKQQLTACFLSIYSCIVVQWDES